jgi:hypothetical protein
MKSLFTTQFSGKTPLLDDIVATVSESVIDEKPINKFSLVAETHNEILTEQSFPWTFSKNIEVGVYKTVKRLVEVSVTVKRIKYDPKRNRIGFWMTATRGGKSVTTHSPTWFLGCPLHSHISETIVKETTGEKEKLKLVKEDPLGAIKEYLLLNASRAPFGSPVGDDSAFIFAYECGFPYAYVGTDGTSFSTLRNMNGNYVDFDNCYTAISAWAPVLSGNYSELDRGCMMFDTSMTENFYITDAAIGTYPNNISDNLGAIYMGLFYYNPTDSGTISASDYQTFGETNYYQNGFVDQWNFDESPHYETINANGRAYLNSNREGNTYFMCRTGHDYNNDPTGLTWASDMRSCVSFNSTDDLPFLILTYTVSKPVLSVNRSGSNLKIGWTVPSGYNNVRP